MGKQYPHHSQYVEEQGFRCGLEEVVRQVTGLYQEERLRCR